MNVSQKIKNLLSFVTGLFRQKSVVFPPIPADLMGIHDCGLRALYVTQPEIPIDKMKRAFLFSCERWPNEGIDNNEFSIALSMLGLKNRWEYVDVDDDNFHLGDFLNLKQDTFIALIPGHYTVVSKGVFFEKSLIGCAHNKKVYCYWRLIIPAVS